MKTLLKICLLTGFVLILSNCSSLPKDWTGISQDDVTVWLKGGFSAKEAQTWKAKGFTPVDASAWRAANFDLDTALKWKGEGFKANEAVAWQKIKFSLRKAKSHRAKGLMPMSLQNPVPTTKQDNKLAETETSASQSDMPKPVQSIQPAQPAETTPAETKSE